MKPITLFIALLAVMVLACQTANTLPTAPAAVMKAPPPVVPTAQTMTICLSTEAVRLRAGAGTGFAELAILSAGDTVTLTGTMVIAEDMGVWQPVKVGGLAGFVNSRFLCEVR